MDDTENVHDVICSLVAPRPPQRGPGGSAAPLKTCCLPRVLINSLCCVSLGVAPVLWCVEVLVFQCVIFSSQSGKRYMKMYVWSIARTRLKLRFWYISLIRRCVSGGWAGPGQQQHAPLLRALGRDPHSGLEGSMNGLLNISLPVFRDGFQSKYSPCI